MSDLSRRTFLGAAAAAGATALGLGLTACASGGTDNAGSTSTSTSEDAGASSSLPANWDKEADVVILGAGGTGLSAACAARKADASVLIVEAASQPGGTTILSGGVIQAAGTEAQKKYTTFQDDTPEKHAACYIEQAEGLADEELVNAICSRAPEMLGWLESIGITWANVYGNCHVPYVSEGLAADRIQVCESGAAGFVEAEVAEAEKLGAEFVFDTKAEHLVLDPEKGVVGVQVNSGGTTQYIKANKGVILALGGMDRNEALTKALNPQQYWDLTTQSCFSSELINGDGIIMGMEINAQMVATGGTIDLDIVTGQGTDNSAPQMPCIMVNGNGMRFVCEDSTYAYALRAVFQQEKQLGKPTYMIMDQNMVEQGIGPWAADPAAAVADGTLLSADTIEELAGLMEVPAQNLVNAMNNWNASIASTGEDLEYGRNTQLIELNKPPYYAHLTTSGNLGALGGLKVNSQAQVVDTAGEVIPRLYAGGMNSGGWYGSYYPGSGTALIGSLVLGHIAGEVASAAEPWA